MRIILCDTNEAVTRFWKELIPLSTPNCDLSIKIFNGTLDSLLEEERRLNTTRRVNFAVVSPGNSFGYLGGGFDLALQRQFGGKSFEKWFRNQLGNRYYPVGSTAVVNISDYEELKDCLVKYIVYCPTMPTPRNPVYDISRPLETGYGNVFNATWNVLTNTPGDVDSLIIPGMCSGYAGVPEQISCKSMAFAIRLFMLSDLISDELKNVLIMYFLGHPYEPFFPKSCKEECVQSGINLQALRKFNVLTDPIDDILPIKLERE